MKGYIAHVNLPNAITLFRFILAGIFAWLMICFMNTNEPAYRCYALGVFIIAAVSDFADGYIARKNEMTTKWGAVMDPVADKLLTLTVLFFLLWVPALREGLYDCLLWVFALLVICREIIIVGGIGALKVLRKDVKISPIRSGKWCTAIQFVTLAALILGVGSFGNILIAISLLFVVVSGAGYLKEGVRIFRQ